MTTEPEEAVDWRDVSGARDRVVELLNASGVPLEAQIARAGQRLETVFSGHHGMSVSSEPLVYGDPAGDQPLRQVDQLVTMYQELELGDLLGVQLILEVPIEAKHRRQAQVFGVEVRHESRLRVRYHHGRLSAVVDCETNPRHSSGFFP